ncbi:sensor histidine kinase [Desulforhopalus singaporensis]|uniref:histidine kinase n=1 Tax=Desulforhopalus singaporensis TaxID=91360 RepID=A0A1H0SBP2_9BACT|nr:HAMP domain-containing sensor histidine kinase [Desulforhopalus singaporensis]SDP39150.1 Signal transduction histidine kinase [Desulforhopalus singaporensis]
MKLFYRLFCYLLLGVLLLIAVDEYLSFRAEVGQFKTDMIASAVQDGRSIAGMISRVWKERGEKEALALLEEAGTPGVMDIGWVWMDVLLASSTVGAEDKKRLQKVNEGEPVSLNRRLASRGDVLCTYYPVDTGAVRQGVLELIQPVAALENFSSRMTRRGVSVFFFLALFSGTILYFFMNRNIRIPLQQLTREAERIGSGDLDAEPMAVGEDELGELARTMNNMRSHLLAAREKLSLEYDARLKTIEQLRHTERLSTFGLIAANIAHEMGTPLNVVDGRAKMIINEELEPGEIKQCAEIIRNQAERMTAIVRQLLDFTRRPKQDIATENIAFLIRQVFDFLHPMASKQRVCFSLVKEESAEVQLRVDGSQIQQVLVNLLMNSVQAMPEGGKVYVNLSNVQGPGKQNAQSGSAKMMKIRIVDEGGGIRKDDLEHIFTPFFTTKTIGTGTGLGLSIAHGIVEEHGGWIDVESNVQNGACFSVYLPMKD